MGVECQAVFSYVEQYSYMEELISMFMHLKKYKSQKLFQKHLHFATVANVPLRFVETR